VKYGAIGIAIYGSPLLCPINAKLLKKCYGRKFTKTPRGLHNRGRGEHFHETFVLHHSNLTNYTIFFVFLMFYDKNTQIFIVFIINHKNTKIYSVFIVRLLWREQTFRENIHPLSCSPRGVFVILRVTFKLLLLDCDTTSVMGGFFPFKGN
jgi:hypothetical protein